MAAIAATQAASLQSQLSYSRQHEQEADRIGMQTLYQSGRDPYAFARMFETMQRSSRFSGARPPEFLLTHPITESRIADARSRAAQLRGRMVGIMPVVENNEYQLMRARVRLHFSENPSQAVRDFRALIAAPGGNDSANQYGLALALFSAGLPADADQALAPLMAAEPNRIAYNLLQAQLDDALGKPILARERLAEQLALNPGNHPLIMGYSQLLQQQGLFEEALVLLRAHSYQRPNDPSIWYQLAELYGLTQHIMALHQARAEYFILNGYLDDADKQLLYALRLSGNDYMANAVIQQRQRDVAMMRQTIKSMGF
jgi:predicted Zn-dependent protease